MTVLALAAGGPAPPAPRSAAALVTETSPTSPTPVARAAASLIEQHGGCILQAQGDEIIAVWGYPHAAGDDAGLAARATAEILSELGCQAALRGGIEAGMVVATAPGPITSMSAAGAGDTVLRARQLRSLAPPGGVLVGPGAAQLLESARLEPWPLEDAGPCWRLTRAACEPRPPRLADPSIAGREVELGILQQAWDAVRSGRTVCLLLRGEVGIGKSAIVQQLRASIVGASGAWIEVACETGLAAPGHQPARGVLDELRSALLSPARARPLALVLEDAHGAGPDLLEAITRLPALVQDDAGVLILTTTRQPREDGPLGHWQELVVGPLRLRDIEELLAVRWPEAVLSTRQRKAIATRSAGNPLFAMELARLAARGRSAPAGESVVSDEPSTLYATLCARLDALGELRPVVQAAALLGPRIDPVVLAAVLEIDERPLRALLDRLVRSGILERAGAGAGDYRFGHDLLRDVACATIVGSSRLRLHLKCAEVLVAEHPRIAAANPELVAWHWSGAGAQAEALAWWRKAALLAVADGAPHAAISHLQQALSARIAEPGACSREVEIELLGMLGMQLTGLRGSAAPQTVATFRHAIELVAQLPPHDRSLEFDLLWGLEACQLLRGDAREALELGERLVSEARERQDESQLILALRMLGVAKLISGAVGEALCLYRDVAERYDVSRHAGLRLRYVSDQGALAHAHIAWAEALRADRRAAGRAVREALELARRLAHPHTSAHVLSVLATVKQIEGDLASAKLLAGSGRRLADRHGFDYWTAWCRIVLGWVEGQAAPLSGMRAIERAIDMYRATGAAQALPYGYMLLASLALEVGDTACSDRALRAAAATREVAERRLYASQLLRLEALRCAATGSSLEHALSLATEAAELALVQGIPAFAGPACDLRASLERKLGRYRSGTEKRPPVL